MVLIRESFAYEGNVKLKLLALLVMSTQLTGCFFFYIPGGAIDALTGNGGNICGSSAVRVGDRVGMPDGKVGVVKKVVGASDRCRANPNQPILLQAASTE